MKGSPDDEDVIVPVEDQVEHQGSRGTSRGQGGGQQEGRYDSSARPNRVRRMHGKRHAGPKRVARQKCVQKAYGSMTTTIEYLFVCVEDTCDRVGILWIYVLLTT